MPHYLVTFYLRSGNTFQVHLSSCDIVIGGDGMIETIKGVTAPGRVRYPTLAYIDPRNIEAVVQELVD